MNDFIRFSVFVACTVVLSRGFIFDAMKDALIDRLPLGTDVYLAKLLYCPMCLGFWVGVVGHLLYPLSAFEVFGVAILDVIGCGLVVSVSAAIIASAIRDI